MPRGICRRAGRSLFHRDIRHVHNTPAFCNPSDLARTPGHRTAISPQAPGTRPGRRPDSGAGPEDQPRGDGLTAPEELEPKKESTQILRHELKEALDALERPANRLFFSGLAAGMEVGFSLFLMAVMLTLAGGRLDDPRVQVILANMYAFGFVLVIVGRSEFFTEQASLAVIPLLNGDPTILLLLSLWTIIYASNLLAR